MMNLFRAMTHLSRFQNVRTFRGLGAEYTTTRLKFKASSTDSVTILHPETENSLQLSPLSDIHAAHQNETHAG